jgi:cysteine dioxygenase
MRVSDTNTVYSTSVDQASRSEYSLDEVAETIRTLKSVPNLSQVKEWLFNLDLRQREYAGYRHFTDRKYARNLIVRGEFAELLLLCWRSGQRTPIHDHGGSIGVVLVCEGLMSETMFDRAPEGHVRPYDTYRWNAGGITGAAVSDIHQLSNLQPAGRDMVTLHCYAPPLSVLNTYSPRSGRVGHWREGYFSGGAGI